MFTNRGSYRIRYLPRIYRERSVFFSSDEPELWKDAKKGEIRTLEDFADYVNLDGMVKLAGSEKFVTSPACL